MATSSEHRAAFRKAIEHFLKERLDAKLDKFPPDDPKRDELIAQHAREICPAWSRNPKSITAA